MLHVLITFCGIITSYSSAYSQGSYKCEPLKEQTCLGEKLDYHYTTTELVTDSSSQDQVKKNLEKWEGLKFLPKCWEVLQPFLCQIYKPKCKNGSVELPCREQCFATRKPCSVVESYRRWPEFLRCDKLPEGNCNGTLKKLHLNESACKAPLVETAYKPSWYEGIEGCGIQCMNPIFSEEEHTRIHRFVAAFGTLTTVCTLFTVVTFLVGWKSQNRYPSVILFFMNACFCVASVGFLIQFSSDARRKVVCRRDDTMRLGEPTESDSFLCVLTFVLVYYFSLAGMTWFVMLAYSWCICFKTLGSTRDNFAGKTGYFHIISWSLPAVLTGCVLLVKQVDANSISGICFVGYKNPSMRAGFLLAPLGLDLVIGGMFLAKGLFTLFKLRKSNPNFLSNRASIKIKETIMRVGFFAFVAFAFVFITFACHVYEYYNQERWERSYRAFLMCIANHEVKGVSNTCSIKDRANLSVLELSLSSLFGAGIAMSGWTWTSNTFKTWKKLWHRVTTSVPLKKCDISFKLSKWIRPSFRKFA
ncbi:predicted protein [Nematostella vectensis]|uniref:Protein smoothened n=1 Tax=Nematostella vectensis TaxID=45351 RepID=A7S829_NEMVE|nr:predicted protein [Nematostella vectensis]|eukprot:XP_001632182.1 predicted protein [Nematostella vectensis]